MSKINSDVHFLFLSWRSFPTSSSSASSSSSLSSAHLLLLVSVALILTQINLLFVFFVCCLILTFWLCRLPNMAILENEKRPRGLRVPSLSSIKANGLSFHKKSEQQQQQSQQQQQLKMESLSETISRPQEKQLPPDPSQTSSPMAAPAPMRIPAASAPAFSLDSVPMAGMLSDRYPMPPAAAAAAANRQPDHGGLGVPDIQRTPSNGSQRSDNTDGDFLDEFIPEPEAEPIVQDGGADDEPVSITGANGNINGREDTWLPPDADIPAPITKLHFACYQEHRSMPVAGNVWHAVPCMTCQKSDREVRHRCVFCALRVCEGCYQSLQKCQRRSLEEFLVSIQA